MNRTTNQVHITSWAPLALASVLSTSVITPASAQVDANPKALAPIVVTASRISQSQTESLPHTTVITAEDISRSRYADLPSLLRREAGVQVYQAGGLGAPTGLFVRGAETRQTLVLIDGVPVNRQDAGGTVNIEHILPDQIERIEIVRGNVSALYGSGAIGGVIQIFTKAGSGAPKFSANAEIGSDETRRLTAGVSGATGPLSFALNLSQLQTDGFSEQDASRAVVNPDDDAYRNRSASGSVSYQLTKHNAVGARFLATEARTEFDADYVPSPRTAEQHTKIGTQLFSVFSNNRINDYWTTDFLLSQSKDKLRSITDSTFSTQTQIQQLQWNNAIEVGPGMTAQLNYERRNEDVETGPVGIKEDRHLDALSTGITGKYGRNDFQANLRWDDYSDVGNETTYYLGYGFHITPEWKLVATRSTAFAAAPLGYLWDTFSGNPDLKPEKTTTNEAGLQWGSGDHLAKLVFFDSQTRQQIVYDFASSRFANVAEVENQGAEFSYTGKLAGLDIRSSLTLQDPVDKTTGKTPNRRAKKLASFGAYKSFGAFSLGGDVTYVGERTDQGRKLSPYSLTNLTGHYRINKELATYLRIENAFGKNYENTFAYNQAERRVFVGLNWQM